jgi:hypothetical protein
MSEMHRRVVGRCLLEKACMRLLEIPSVHARARFELSQHEPAANWLKADFSDMKT